MSHSLRRRIRALSFLALTIAIACGTGLSPGPEDAQEEGAMGTAYCPNAACASTDACCTSGSCSSNPRLCIPVPSSARGPIAWWTDSRKTYQSGACGGYDTDNGYVGAGNTIVLPHDSEYLGNSSDTTDYNNCTGAWGFGPTFYDTVTHVKFHLNHIKPGSPLANVAAGTVLKAGSYVGRSGGDTCETGYCSTGYSSTSGFANCLVCVGQNAGTCPLEGGGTGHCAIAHSCASSATAAAHLCVVMNGSSVPAAFCPTSTTPGCGSSPIPSCTVCSGNDSQCGPSSYEMACTGGACTGDSCCCPAKQIAMSGSFAYCCPAGQHYGPLTGGGAGCVADNPGCSANDSQCTAYGAACTGGSCTSSGCCCPTERTCQSGSFPYCCAEGTHCGTLPGGGEGCVADASIGGGCAPNCSGRTCGPDPNGCATSCGSCQSGWTCSSSGTCVPPPPTCPTGSSWYGAGQYCYFQPGMANTTPTHLYSCGAAGAVASDLGNCGEGCHGMPPGYNDVCYSAYCPTGGYWYGAGLYCGHGPGMTNANPDIVYYCSGPGAKGSVNQRCSGACVVAPPGVNDHC
jgi:hypothetical protein